MKKRVVQLVVGCLISAALLIWVFWDTDWSVVGAEIGNLKWWAMIPALGMIVLHYILRSWRWRYLLPEVARSTPTIKLFDALAIGNMASFLLPLRIGEFIRPLVLTKWAPLGFAAAFVSVVIERFFDLSAVLLTLPCIAPLLPSLPPILLKGAMSLGVLAAAILLFLLSGALAPSIARTLVNTACRFLPAGISRILKKITDDILAGAAMLKSAKSLLMVVLLTACVWGTCYMQFYFFLKLFSLPATLLMGATFGVVIALSVALPSAPGFVGVYQAGCVLAFQIFGLDHNKAVAYSLVSHAAMYVLLIVLGVIALVRNDLSLFELRGIALKRAEEQS